MTVDVRMNMAAFVDLSNRALQQIAVPAAERVAAAAGAGYEVQVTPRTSVAGWARARVVTATVSAMVAERRTGNLVRAFGAA